MRIEVDDPAERTLEYQPTQQQLPTPIGPKGSLVPGKDWFLAKDYRTPQITVHKAPVNINLLTNDIKTQPINDWQNAPNPKTQRQPQSQNPLVRITLRVTPLQTAQVLIITEPVTHQTLNDETHNLRSVNQTTGKLKILQQVLWVIYAQR